MLVKVQCKGVKKWVKLLDDFTFQDFLTEVKNKFGFTRTTSLQVFDDTDTNVEEDVFQELIQASPDMFYYKSGLCSSVQC